MCVTPSSLNNMQWKIQEQYHSINTFKAHTHYISIHV